MKKLLVLALALLLTTGALAEPTALDAFHALMGSDAAEASAPAGEWLDAALTGRFDRVPEEAGEKAAFAENLEPLAAIANRDLTAYASAHGMPVGQVRNAWYRALANVLSAGIEQDPASGEQHENARAILALFLSLDGESAEADRQEIRRQMTAELGRRIAEQYGLPEAFVDFVIMSSDWDDDSWENDDDWRETFDWDEAPEDAFEDIAIGSRDGDGSTRIADIQELLISLGYLKGKADGVFGPRTQAALIEFQLANGMPGDGIYSAGSLERARSADVVARWDYGEDFWDSTDFDADGDSPDDADTPDSPDSPD